MLNNLLIRLRDYRHRWAHRLHLTHGYVVSGWSGRALWIGYQCDECGAVTGAHVSSTWGDHEPSIPPTSWQR